MYADSLSLCMSCGVCVRVCTCCCVCVGMQSEVVEYLCVCVCVCMCVQCVSPNKVFLLFPVMVYVNTLHCLMMVQSHGSVACSLLLRDQI